MDKQLSVPDSYCRSCDVVVVVELGEMHCPRCGGLLRESPFDFHGQRPQPHKCPDCGSETWPDEREDIFGYPGEWHKPDCPRAAASASPTQEGK